MTRSATRMLAKNAIPRQTLEDQEKLCCKIRERCKTTRHCPIRPGAGWILPHYLAD